MKKDIRMLLREASEQATEKKEGNGGESPGQYERIQRVLKDDMFNHSKIIDDLYGAGSKEDASIRSLFRKKLNREEYQGTKYEFDSDELAKIGQSLMATSTFINKNLGKNEQ